MSNAETPAENQGGTTATPDNGPLAALPDRIRVHALAKLLGSSSRELLTTLSELGVAARSAQSSMSREDALRVAESLGVTGLTDAGPEITQPTSEPATEPTEPTRSARTEPAPSAADRADRGAAPSRPATPFSAPPETPAGLPEPAAPAAPHVPVFAAPSPVFLPPEPEAGVEPGEPARAEAPEAPDTTSGPDTDDSDESESAGRRRRRRGRRGRGRGKGGDDTGAEQSESAGKAEPSGDGADKQDKSDKTDKSEKSAKTDKADKADKSDKTGKAEKFDKAAQSAEAEPDTNGDEAGAESGDGEDGETSSRRRRRRRRRKGGADTDADTTETGDDPPNTVVHVRETKGETAGRDGVRSVRGSTRLEAKRQRRRDGREAGRRRAPILSESEFLARRESVDRTMVVAERDGSTQIGVLEDGVLVEHFVTTSGSGSIVGNVYLGRVQNVLPSMEAAFIDIGRGRNAVLYAGEVDWDAAGLEGKARKIEQALSTGDNVLVQVTKDPVGHKGARLTTQISLPGRFLVYVPSGGATGISRKLPENERRRLKDILKRIVPEDAGVIIRTASEGISEAELERDVRRLKAQWEVIKEKAAAANGSSGKKKSGAPAMLYEEPDLLVKVVRDLFTEDFGRLEVQGETAWETISAYVEHVAPDLRDRLKKYTGTGDVFADYRIDEQLTKALDRKVWLPSGGYLVIDRTEAMTVIDVNTGKFTGSGGNLEETVTRNNLESAEEIVRQLRLRDIGGIIVIDFIDMVLESNRELVLRRLTECLGRDRTRHQVAEVTSLGLVQMTRKRVGTGLLESFSTTCEHCKGRGVLISTEPQRGNGGGGHQHGGSRRSRGRGKADDGAPAERTEQAPAGPTPEQRESVVSAVQAMASASKTAKGGEGDSTGHEETPRNGRAPAAESGGRGERKAPRGRKDRAERAEPAAVGTTPESGPAPERPGTGAAEAGAADAPAGLDRPGTGETAPAPEPAGEEKVTDGGASTEREPEARPESAHPAEPMTPAPTGQEGGTGEPTQPEVPHVPAPAVRSTTRRPRRRAASRPAGPPVNVSDNT
ncbi:ribonuclease E [Amycolatopsis arida]|uniref:Ribonuclease E n=1 Tax=Amycolatopsis arida TaxID=587909 RepID=A0A1I5US61_9PSEU|nr:translation initiation factor IF-2 N-terminal domain-containing protein [Amycolatopsis arida]TDX91015.1 ribonuclease E [Amycolatopsis arida]SFP98091.1 ribonuclease E [Amycolatopsis arida]